MSKDTSIQWCDSSVNPVMGCDGCELWQPRAGGKRTCYAGVMVERYKGRKGYPASFLAPEVFPGRTLEAAKWGDLRGKDRPDKPWLNGAPRLIFVSDMGDALSGAITFDALKREIVDVAGSAALGGSKHVWLWLTKRPTRMAAFADWLLEEHGVAWPRNLWPMTTVTSQQTVRRIEMLHRVGERSPGGGPGGRAVSFEPLLGPVKLGALAHAIEWGIIGGESENTVFGQAGRAAPLTLSVLTDVVEELANAGVPTFVKQLGSRFTSLRISGKLVDGATNRMKDHHGGDWGEWPAELRIRQLPEVWRGREEVREVSDGVSAVGVGDPAGCEVRREPHVAHEVPRRDPDSRGEVEEVSNARGKAGAPGTDAGDRVGTGLFGGGRHL